MTKVWITILQLILLGGSTNTYWYGKNDKDGSIVHFEIVGFSSREVSLHMKCQMIWSWECSTANVTFERFHSCMFSLENIGQKNFSVNLNVW